MTKTKTYAEIYANAQKEKTGKSIVPTFHKFEEAGDTIVGKFIKSYEVFSQESQSHYNQYLFNTDDGNIKCHFGAATDKEIEASLISGGVYSIKYEGEEKIDKVRSVNKFEILELMPPPSEENENGNDGEPSDF